MQKLLKNLKISRQTTSFLALNALLFFGLFSRLYRFTSSQFGFDQVQIIDSAQKILNGDFTLIGPRTGPAEMFTGPLIYYLTAPFMALFGVWSVVIVPGVLAMVTGISLFLLAKKYLGLKEALLIFSVWAMSPFLIQYDRTLWNPDLSLLAFSLVFFPLLGQKHERVGLGLVCLGSSLAYQAHFSGLLTPILVLVSILFYRKSITYLISSLAGLGLSLMPTLLFDLRHDWLNARGLANLLLSKKSEEYNLFFYTVLDFFHSLYIASESLGKIFISNINSPIVVVTGTVLICLALFNRHKNRENYFALLWILSISLIFSFYHSSKPEYYYFIMLPALLVLAAHALANLSAKHLLLLLMSALGYSTWMTLAHFARDPGLSLGNDLKVKKVITELNNNQGVKEIILDIDALNYDSFGIKFLLKSIPFKEDGATVHVTYPNRYTFNHITQVGDIGIWVDPRVNNLNYLTENDYIIATPLSIRLLKNVYPTIHDQGAVNYEIFDQESKNGQLFVIKAKGNERLEWVKTCLQSQSPVWISIATNEQVKYFNQFCFRYVRVDEEKQNLAGQINIE